MKSKMNMLALQEGSCLGLEDTCKFDLSKSKSNLSFIDIIVHDKNATQILKITATHAEN